MSRRKRNKGATTMPMATIEAVDLGPKIQHTNGTLVVDREATDPERPNGLPIRRAMRHPHYDRMHGKGDITDGQREACDAYAVLTERRDGARWTNGEHVGGSAHPAFRGHPTMTQVQASARISSAHAALGNDASALLGLFVVQDVPIGELARRRKEDEKVTKGRVLASIARLAEHWGMGAENTR